MITSEKNGNISVININEPLDSKNSLSFEESVNKIASSGGRIIAADFNACAYISSAGIGSLLFAHKKMTSLGGRFFFYNVPSSITELFRVIGVYDSLYFTTSIERAADFPFKTSSALPEIPQNDNSGANEDVSAYDGVSAVDPYDGSAPFREALVVECANCSSYTRVHRPGDYICPSCHSEFTVETDGTVIF